MNIQVHTIEIKRRSVEKTPNVAVFGCHIRRGQTKKATVPKLRTATGLLGWKNTHVVHAFKARFEPLFLL
jgi:hypothetical protein